MFRQILVPTDFTPKSSRALDIAVKLAVQGCGEVNLLHVIETIEGTQDADFEAFYAKLRKRAEKNMQQAVKDYNNRGPLIRTTILFGKRAPGIVDFAHQNKIDLIVLSSHKIDRRDPLSGWGTISYKVAFLAHCPVMMVK